MLAGGLGMKSMNQPEFQVKSSGFKSSKVKELEA